MSDHHHSKVHLLLDFLDQGQNTSGGLGIQGAGSFIAEEDRWLGGQGSGYGYPLLLATAESGDMSISPALQPYQGQKLLCPLTDIFLRLSADFHWICDIACGSTGREKIEVLEDHSYLSPFLDHLFPGKIIHPLVSIPDLSLVRSLKHAYKPYQGRLACPASSNYSIDCIGWYLKGYPVYSMEGTIVPF